ncbi:hypothetical protein AAHA92_01583 [Salvia divinorum]|uniref:RRM domain-containing protein n=1 Tax=Salvia divinorum TaxID=28513 RepID=A0ABD1IB06_SALDI
MRALFCGNIPYETRYSELEELFSQCGKVASVDIKKGHMPRKMSFYVGLPSTCWIFLTHKWKCSAPRPLSLPSH